MASSRLKRTRLTNFPVEPMPFDNYVAMARNSVKGDIHMFRNAYAYRGKSEKFDATEDGNLACAYFLSALLYLQKFLSEMHFGVTGLEKDLHKLRYCRIDRPRVGAVVFWGPEGPRNTRHVGMASGRQKIIYSAVQEKFYTKDGTEIYYHEPDGRELPDNGSIVIETAISHNDLARKPIMHHLHCLGLYGRQHPRPVEAIYWHPCWDRFLGRY